MRLRPPGSSAYLCLDAVISRYKEQRMSPEFMIAMEMTRGGNAGSVIDPMADPLERTPNGWTLRLFELVVRLRARRRAGALKGCRVSVVEKRKPPPCVA